MISLALTTLLTLATILTVLGLIVAAFKTLQPTVVNLPVKRQAMRVAPFVEYAGQARNTTLKKRIARNSETLRVNLSRGCNELAVNAVLIGLIQRDLAALRGVS